jgi:uncharacterized SAM-binding protein YcdF (DUF218 family)
MSDPPSTVRRKVVLSALALGFITMVLVVVATARLFIWPPTDLPAKADAVVALGGDPGQRRAKSAMRLAREGYAPVAVISLGGKRAVPCPPAVPGVELICFRANPLDTRGEAEYVARLASRQHWNRIIVVSERSQATRARMLFKRCTGIQLLMVPVTDPRVRLPFDVAYEWAALIKALVVVRSC